MRRAALLATVLLGAVLGTGQLDAQVPNSGDFPVDRDTAFTPGPKWRHRILTALGGAALGAGLGYFASQLSRSDWDEHPQTNPANRGVWVSAGGGVGLALGLAFPLHGPTKPVLLGPRISDVRAVITGEQIRSVAATNAYDVVRILRPEWLTPRKADVFGDDAAQTLPVYLDDFRLGGLESLREVALQTVESIRLLSTSAATARWGIGHNNGAIQVITSG